MKIAIISDIHDQSDNLKWAVQKIKELKVDQVFALGDYSSPYIVERLGLVGVPVVAVWGNNDGDQVAMFKAVLSDENNQIYFKKGNFAEVEYAEGKYFLTHYPLLAENAAMSGKYDAVFHGHTHRQRNEIINNTPIVNPGKLAVYPDDKISFAVYDTENKKVKFFEKQKNIGL
jgi:putative phosphoesterase